MRFHSTTDPHGPDTSRLLRIALVWGVVPTVVALLAGLGLAAVVEDPFGDFVRDLKVTTGAPIYAGSLSSFTFMVWTAGASVALATAVPARRSGPMAVLLLMLGVLTLALALDDQFLIHDGVLLGLGLPGELALGAYAAWGLVTVVKFRDLLRARPETPLLAIGVLLLAGSLAVDLVAENVDLSDYETARIFAEDGLKLVGAAVWSVGLGALARAVQVATFSGVKSETLER